MELAMSPAPVDAHAEVDIAASERVVWSVLVDIASWPTWNPAIRFAAREEALEVGSRFQFATEIGTLKCRVTTVDAPRFFSWQGRVLVLGERQAWRLDPTDEGTHVAVHAQMTGLGSRLLRRPLQDRLQRVMDAVVQLLRLEAEVRSAEALEEAERRSVLEQREQGR